MFVGISFFLIFFKHVYVSSVFISRPKDTGCVFIFMLCIKQRESIFCAKDGLKRRVYIKGGGICEWG